MKNGARLRQPNSQKISGAIVCLAFVELALLAVVVIQSAVGREDLFSVYRLPAVMALAALVTFDVVCAIYTARQLRIWRENVDAVSTSLSMVEQLNGTLRSQRHDFLNHLQVISGLIEMREFEDATDYIHRILKDTGDVSRVLRTKNPAVNALLSAKYAMCQKRGIAFDMVVRTPMERLPVEDWQMCRVLSNLIDNAAEATEHAERKSRVIRLVLDENEDEFFFRVGNNGPAVPQELAASIFSPGVSTKGEGRGMGLFIVREVVSSCGGTIECAASGDWTVFSGTLPKKKQG